MKTRIKIRAKIKTKIKIKIKAKTKATAKIRTPIGEEGENKTSAEIAMKTSKVETIIKTINIHNRVITVIINTGISANPAHTSILRINS